jgi:hypothetical protein
MEAAVLEGAGVTADVFQKSLLAHQHNQLLQQTVMAMQVSFCFNFLPIFLTSSSPAPQMENQQKLAHHGIQLSM